MAQRAEAKYRIVAQDKTKGAMKSIQGSMKAVGVAMLATFGANAVKSLISDSAKEMDELAKSARRLGMSAKEMDAWQYVAQLNGASVETMTKSIKKLNTSMYDAGLGLKTYTDIFDDLNVEYANADGTLRGTNEVMFDVADALNGMENQAQKTALQVKLFGRAGLDMALILGKGSDALRDQLADGYATSGMYGEMMSKGEDFIDAQLRMNRAFRNVKFAVASYALPGLTSLADALSEKLLDALTHTTSEFRRQMGELMMMPTEAKLESIGEMQVEVMASIDSPISIDYFNEMLEMSDNLGVSLQAMMEERIGWKRASEVMDVEPELRALHGELKATEKAIADKKAELAQRKSQLAYDEGQREIEEAEKALAGMRKEAEMLILGQTSAQTKLIEKLNEYKVAVDNGLISEEQYLALKENTTLALTALSDEEIYRKQAIEATKNELESIMTPQEIYSARITELEERLIRTNMAEEDFNKLVAQAKEELHLASNATDEWASSMDDFEDASVQAFRQMESVGQTAMRSISDAIATTFVEGKNLMESLADLSQNILMQFISTLIQMGVSDITATSNYDTGPDFIGPPAPRGNRASGGGVTSGHSYLVGENGAEVFVPTQSGSIEQAGGEVTVQMNIQALDSRDVLSVISEQKSAIVGMVQQEFNKKGMRGFAR